MPYSLRIVCGIFNVPQLFTTRIVRSSDLWLIVLILIQILVLIINSKSSCNFVCKVCLCLHCLWCRPQETKETFALRVMTQCILGYFVLVKSDETNKLIYSSLDAFSLCTIIRILNLDYVAASLLSYQVPKDD